MNAGTPQPRQKSGWGLSASERGIMVVIRKDIEYEK